MPMKKNANNGKSRNNIKAMEKKTLKKADKMLSTEKRLVRNTPRAREEPIAISHVNSYRAPKTKTVKGGTIFAHTDAVADIGSGPIGDNGAISFNIDEYDINPGLASVFLWAAPVVAQYEMYELEYLEFIWNPNVPTTVTGDLIMAFDPDPFNSPPTSSMQMKQMTHSISGSAYKVFRLRIPKSTFANKKKFVRTENDPSPTDPDATKQYEDIRLVDAGKFYIARVGIQTQEGTPITDLGTWSIKYSIRATSMKEKVGPQTAPFDLQAYSNSCHFYSVLENAKVEYDGSFSNLLVTSNSTSSLLTFDAQFQQPVNFHFVAESSEVDGELEGPTLKFNGQVLGNNDFEYARDFSPGGKSRILGRGQFIVLPVDQISPNVLELNFYSSIQGISTFLLTIGATQYPFIPMPPYSNLRGALSTIPQERSYRLRKLMQKNGWTIPKVTKDPPKFIDYGDGKVNVTKVVKSVPVEKVFQLEISDKFQLPDIEDLGTPTRLEKAMADARISRQTLVRIPSDSSLSRQFVSKPKLYNVNETMKNAMSYSEIAQTYPWVQSCTEPLRIPALAAQLNHQQMQKVGAALGSKENNTFQEILDTVSQVTEIGTKIFSLFG